MWTIAHSTQSMQHPLSRHSWDNAHNSTDMRCRDESDRMFFDNLLDGVVGDSVCDEEWSAFHLIDGAPFGCDLAM